MAESEPTSDMRSMIGRLQRRVQAIEAELHSMGRELRTEPPWVRWRLGLLDSNPGGVGLLGSVERCFELGGRRVAAVAVEALLVEPVDP